MKIFTTVGPIKGTNKTIIKGPLHESRIREPANPSYAQDGGAAKQFDVNRFLIPLDTLGRLQKGKKGLSGLVLK